MSWLSHRMIRNETLLSKSMFSSRKFIVSNCNLQKRIQGQRGGGVGGRLGFIVLEKVAQYATSNAFLKLCQ